jgi:transposase InsO family protein
VKREQKKAAEEQIIVELVQNKRQKHPRMGGRKVLHEIRPMMNKLGIYRGRDAFFKLLGKRDLLVPQKRNKRRTTRSGLWKCPNLIAGLELDGINQVWVADITYLTTEQGFVYLALLTDAFSRYIVGYDVSSSLAVAGCLRALNSAIALSSSPKLEGLIHHSDHGLQYTAWNYCDRLRDVNVRSSMGEVGNCYDNPLAERMNGILKNEYALDSLFINQQHAQAATREAIYLYNYERPHNSLNLSKPAHIHFS